ncbi:L-seryl-tRNA(Sec) selenium transferase [subsurface metagenome]
MPDAAQQVRSALKNLPSVDDLLTALPPEHYRLTRRQIKAAIRGVLDEVRQEILQGTAPGDIAKVVKATVARRVAQLASPNLMPVINGTGVVLHTGLGRAPLGGEVLDRAIKSVRGYASLELDLPSGKRGERLAVVADALQALTGAEDMVVVNNNAAAVLLMLNTAAEGREVIVSRGQQVEIGGSFRIPDVIRKAYAHMVEVGTTNRTHLADYENAVTPDTAALLYVHPSNYRVRGFTKEVPVSDLAGLANKKKLPLLVDLGSGSILDQPVEGLTEEPSAAAGCLQG